TRAPTSSWPCSSSPNGSTRTFSPTSIRTRPSASSARGSCRSPTNPATGCRSIRRADGMAAAEAVAPADAQGRVRYRALARRKLLILSGLGVALWLAFATDLALGPALYSLGQVAEALFNP